MSSHCPHSAPHTISSLSPHHLITVSSLSPQLSPHNISTMSPYSPQYLHIVSLLSPHIHDHFTVLYTHTVSSIPSQSPHCLHTDPHRTHTVPTESQHYLLTVASLSPHYPHTVPSLSHPCPLTVCSLSPHHPLQDPLTVPSLGDRSLVMEGSGPWGSRPSSHPPLPDAGEVDLLVSGGAEALNCPRLQEHDWTGGLGPALWDGCPALP